MMTFEQDKPAPIARGLKLFCLHCGTELSLVSQDRQRADGRILCLTCRVAEAGWITGSKAGFSEEPVENGWWDVAALGAIVALVWAALYFL